MTLTLRNIINRIQRSLRSRYYTFCRKKRANKKQLFQRRRELGSPSSVVWIFGCQRSGTTLVENIFRHNLSSAVFGEFSDLSIHSKKTVLSSADRIQAKLLSQNAEYGVIRPLYESDRAFELIKIFPSSVGLWVFRDVDHVVDSMIRKWGGDFFKISERVESDEDGHWRLKEVASELQILIDKGGGDRRAIAEAYGRYWIERNQLPIKLGLHEDSRFLFLDYGHLVSAPKEVINRTLEEINHEVWSDFTSEANTKSHLRPVDSLLSDETRRKAESVLRRLQELSRRDFGY